MPDESGSSTHECTSHDVDETVVTWPGELRHDGKRAWPASRMRSLIVICAAKQAYCGAFAALAPREPFLKALGDRAQGRKTPRLRPDNVRTSSSSRARAHQ